MVDFSEGVRGKFFGKKPKIEMAATDKVEDDPTRLERLLRLIAGQLYGPESKKDWRDIWVSNESMLGDFNFESEQLAALGRELGFEVKHSDYIDQILAKMKE